VISVAHAKILLGNLRHAGQFSEISLLHLLLADADEVMAVAAVHDSESGPQRTFLSRRRMSAFEGRADEGRAGFDFRF
jgi:hypothetical protein